MGASVIAYPAANDRPGGGAAAYRNISLLATGQVVKASAGRLYGYHLYNSAGAAAFVKIYNKATAASSSDTPALTLPIAAGGVVFFNLPAGIAFDTGISVRACTGVADNDNTAPSANNVIVNVFYA